MTHASIAQTDPARALVAQKRDEAGAYDDMLDEDGEPYICDECGSVGTPGALLIDPSDEDGALAWYCQECQNDWQAVAAYEASLSNELDSDYLAFVSEPSADPTNGGPASPNDAPIPLPAEEPPTTPQTGGRAPANDPRILAAALTNFSLPAATPAVEDNASTSCPSDTLGDSTTRDGEDAAPHRCPDCGDPVEARDQRCRACREDMPATHATLMALLKAALEEWKACDMTTPYDVELAALARAIAMDGTRTQEQICGEALAYAYCAAPAPFLAEFDSFGAKRQSAITHAVAAWMGKSVGEVDQLWLESRLRLMQTAI